MKKAMLSMLALMCVLLLLPVFSSFAENGKVLIHDEAGIFGADTYMLEEKARSLSREYGFDTVIWTTNDYMSDATMKRKSAAFYDRGGYSENGIIMLITMNSRNRGYWICGTGGGVELEQKISDSVFLSYLKNGRYTQAASAWIDKVENYLSRGYGMNSSYGNTKNAAPRDPAETKRTYSIIAVVASCVIALIVVLVMRGKMKTARAKRDAADYLVRSSFNLTRVQDIYLYSTTVKRKIETSTSSGSHGGSHGGGGHGGHF